MEAPPVTALSVAPDTPSSVFIVLLRLLSFLTHVPSKYESVKSS